MSNKFALTGGPHPERLKEKDLELGIAISTRTLDRGGGECYVPHVSPQG